MAQPQPERIVPIVIAPGRLKFLGFGLLACAFLALLALFDASWAKDAAHYVLGSLLLLAVSLAIASVFLWLLTISLYRVLSSRPALVIDERGIQDNISAIGSGVGMIPWHDVVALSVYSRSSGGVYPTPRLRYLGIAVTNPAELPPRYPRYLRWLLRSSTTPHYADVAIPQRIIHGSVDEVLHQIEQRYADILARHRIVLLENDKRDTLRQWHTG